MKTSGNTEIFKNLKAEIVIIGGGGAGLSAALAATEKGAKVILLEKRRTAGGNSAMATGIFAAESHIQKRMKINAQSNELIKTALDYAHWAIDPKIIRAFVNKSGDTVRWLEERGVTFADVPHFLPNQIPRVFHVPEGRGAALIKALVNQCKELSVPALYETAAKRILINKKGVVIGVLATTKEKELRFSAKSVIIATGGYAGNKELLKKYYPHYTENLYLVGLPHQGDGLLMANEIGAATEGLGILLLHGPYYRGPHEVITAAMQPSAIWLNKKGERFIDETNVYWPEAANALNRQPDKISFTLFDERLKQDFIRAGFAKGYRTKAWTPVTDLGKNLQIEAGKGGVKISDSLEEMAQWMGADPKVLKATINEYNSFCDQGYDEIFLKDRRFLLPLRTPPYYALKCYQGFLNTIGGIKINHHIEVLNHEDKAIPGLYAAGSDTGGWESETYCLSLSGAAFGFAINSGRIAGENATEFVLAK